jgi:uncharacterized membrane protein YeaQ/YmgE (transglycosylase-associated protein family)
LAGLIVGASVGIVASALVTGEPREQVFNAWTFLHAFCGVVGLLVGSNLAWQLANRLCRLRTR